MAGRLSSTTVVQRHRHVMFTVSEAPILLRDVRLGQDSGVVSSPKAVSAAPIACSWCGTTVDEVPLTWMLQASSRGTLRLCEVCTRDHVRQIEAQLPTEWW